MEKTVEKETKDPEELVEAKIQFYKSQSKLFDEQARKEMNIAIQHELAADEAKRLHDEVMSSNNQNRFYDYVGPVTTDSTEKAMQTLSRWKRQSSEQITIRISSPGGNVLDGLALYDFIVGLKNSGIHVRTVVLGVAASMAAVLLQAGSTRVVGPNARILIHEVSGGSQGKLSELKDEAKFFESLNEQLYTILSERAKMTAKEIGTKAKRVDWWLNSKEILDRGFADEVGIQ